MVLGVILMHKYEIIIYWSDTDEAFIAEVPDLPGCAADGKTRQEDVEAETDLLFSDSNSSFINDP